MLVFLSHNKSDKSISREIALFLVAENVNVWFDEWEIAAGDSIIEEINKGLHSCTHFVIIWSRNSAKSNWVRRELYSTLSRAIEKGTPKVIPICIDNTPLPQLLYDILYISYEGGTEEDRNQIVSSITGHKPSQVYIRAIVKKYQEVIFDDNATDPFGIKACPSCGGMKLKFSTKNDERRDSYWAFVSCEECEWMNGTEL